MATILRSSYLTPIVVLLLIVFQQTDYPPEPTEPELQKLKEKWLTVESWSASYEENYTVEKTYLIKKRIQQS